MFSKQKRREAYSGLVINMGMLSTLKTVHEYKYYLADSVNIAHSNALLSYGKKGRDVDTFDELRYTMVMTTDKSATVLPPTEDAFKEHVIHAKCHTLRRWTRHSDNAQSAPDEVRDLTHLYCTYKECVDVRKCSCLLAGLLCIDVCFVQTVLIKTTDYK